jgi:hypothetical protein
MIFNVENDTKIVNKLVFFPFRIKLIFVVFYEYFWKIDPMKL